MRIKKRDGRFEQLSFDKVIFRLRKLCNDPTLSPLQHVDPDIVAQQVVSRIYDGVTSCELDEEAARIAVNFTNNMEYHSLASRIIISNMHKSTNEKFSDVMELLYNNIDTNGNQAPILADDIINIIRKHKDVLDNVIKYERDYLFDYFGFKTLEKSYLQKIMDHNTKQMRVVERPQHLYMRVAVGIHKDDIASAIKTYDLISQHFYTHASPTLFNSSTRLANLSSCFHEDTIVATVNRGPVKIKDVKVGDEVVTHKGNVKEVVQLHKNPLNNRKFYELNIAKTAPVKVTDNHKVWAVKVEKHKQGKKHGDKRQMYDIEFVREYLAKDNCQLLSSEYKNIKTKLNFICFCGREANASFESIYYGDIRCNSRECIFKRKSKFCKQKTYSDPKWISVEELEKGDYVCIPNKIVDCKNEYVIDVQDFDTNIKNDKQVEYEYDVEYTETCATVSTTYVVPTYSYQQTRKHQEVNKKWVITSDVAKFIGVFYGDGHIIKAIGKDGKERIRGIGITIHSKNVDLIYFCVRTGEQLFGIKACIHKMHNQNVVQVLFNSMIIGFVFKQLFGVYFDGKKIWSDMFQWNKLLVHSLLEGIVTTDGCVTKDGTVMIQMSNVQFMRDLYYLLRNNNIDVSFGNPQRQLNGTTDHVNINIPAKHINFNNINKIYSDDRLKNTSINKCRNQYSSITVNDFTFLPVRSKKELLDDLPDYVYTLGIEDDHSYNVEGIVAHNCFLLGTEDSLEGIFKTFTDCGKISKVGGGIGVHISNIRAKGSIIRGTNGVSDGIVPMLKVYNQVSTYINQSGRRKGSFAMYIEPWHADIMEFLDMRKNQGHEELRARDLFYALWTPDLFMKQVEKNGDWYLMCPDECPGLNDAYGDEFEKLYWSYVEQKKYKRVVKAQDVWTKILDSQIETGVPYIGYKDAVNKKCNQKNLGTIKSSNLCIEISLYSDNEQYSVCNLCSIALPKFVEYKDDGTPFFNFSKLKEVAEYTVHPMNKVIDHNYYPTPETEKSNMAHRPLGIGAQGLADVYFKMKLPFESKEAAQLNKEIFETIYYGTLRGSIELAKLDGKYASFDGSPFSEGKLQFDLAAEFDGINLDNYLSGRWDWDGLRKDLKEYGARNSMLIALMPTASSAQIMGNTESFEPIDSCIFKRRVLSGEYMVVNKYLVKELEHLGLWNKEMKDLIIAHDGSIQNISSIPDNIKRVYKTVWELSMKSVIEQCRDRGVFVDQMQSMNLFMANPNYKKLTSMHFYSWKNHLKSGMYYLRSKNSASAGKFSIDASLEKQIREKQESGKQLTQTEEQLICSIDNKDACMMCSS